MTRPWGVLVMIGLVSSVGCRKKPQPEPLPVPGASAVDQAAGSQQTRADEPQVVAPAALDQKTPPAPHPNAASAEETAKRDRMAQAQEAAQQQGATEKLSRKGPHSKAKPGEAPHAVMAAHQEVTATAVAPAAPGLTQVHFRSDAGNTFRLIEAHFMMDGAELPIAFNSAERGKSYLLTSDLAAGRHAFTAQLTYQGASHGVFNYMNGYTFKVTSDEVLTTTGARDVSFTIVCQERKGLNIPLEKRLMIAVEGHHTH